MVSRENLSLQRLDDGYAVSDLCRKTSWTIA